MTPPSHHSYLHIRSESCWVTLGLTLACPWGSGPSSLLSPSPTAPQPHTCTCRSLPSQEQWEPRQMGLRLRDGRESINSLCEGKSPRSEDEAAPFMSVTQGLSFSNLTPHRRKNFCECPLILNMTDQCAFKSTRYAFSFLLYAEAKKEGLHCSECQVGFLCSDQIKHAFLLSAFLMTQSLVHQTSLPERS